MFSIAAINDTDSKAQWEPLAPTKEAQEFHLSQTYHEGLLKLHAKEYEKARELLECVLRDPLISSAQVHNSASDSHILQLRFLALKNLATTFLQMGSTYQENALKCYLEAVEIDTKDTVVWNQLGTLSCSMGSLSISRWAFEQGLLCSPSNWNCMEKLLEVLIAIGDEVACLTVAEMILRHWPSHSRALHVKRTIEESEVVPFAPRGIDKLEPNHIRLKFLDKRKATDEISDGDAPLKRLKQRIELQLPEASWRALIDALLDVLTPLSEEKSEKELRSGDVQLEIKLPCSESLHLDDRGINTRLVGEEVSQSDSNTERENVSKDKATCEDQPQERRSTRLGRLRSRKPEKEEPDFASSKDSDAVIKFLEPFIASRADDNKHSERATSSTSICHQQACPFGTESSLLAKFVHENSNNYGAYHVAHLLLEEAARRNFICPTNACSKLLELEKLTRNWGQDRTLECNIFLGELCYDFALTCHEASQRSNSLSDASYHLCKVIEFVSMDYPLGASDSINNLFSTSQGSINLTADAVYEHPGVGTSLLKDKSPFWIRFFWLSGRLSVLDGNNAKAEKEFNISLSLFLEKESTDNSFSIHMPHCKTVGELTVDRVLYEINKLKMDILMEKAAELIEKENYVECINSLAPVLFCTKDVCPDILPLTAKGDEISLTELSALDLLIKASEKTEPVDFDVCYNCHQRKLQILMATAGLQGSSISHNTLQQSGSSAPGLELRRNSSMQWNWLVAEEVKAISQCISEVKSGQSGDPVGNDGPASSIGDVQSLLLAVMCNIASMLSSRKPTESEPVDVSEKKQKACFINAAIAFCKFQHLDPAVPIKAQTELIMAIHDLLAECGICCAGEGNEGEEGTFLKFAIKHLLALDMKLKSYSNSSNEHVPQLNQQLSVDILPETNSGASIIESETVASTAQEARAMENDVSGDVSANDISVQKVKEKDHMEIDGFDVKVADDNKPVENGSDLTEDEREELESKIENALDQCFFCLYGLNLRADSSYDDELANHKNTSRGEYQTKEQCADVFQYILPYARGSSRTGLMKLRRVLRTIRKHFQQPHEEVLAVNFIDKFLDNMELCEDKLSEEAGSDGFLQTMVKILFAGCGSLKQYKKLLRGSSDPYMDVYSNLYFFLAQSEEMSATDKWTGFVLTKEGEEFVQQNAALFKYDLLYNPLRFESWQRLANIYDEEVDLLLNDGSKHINVAGWRKDATLPNRVETSRRRSRRCLIMSLALAKTPAQQCEMHELLALVYYDSIQNVVPFYDQRSVVPTKDATWMKFCESSFHHFQKAFEKKEDWSHAFYLGKLSEKLKYSHEMALSYYDKAISLNPSAVDPVYRMNASRVKLLWRWDKKDLEGLKVVSTHCFNFSVKAAALDILGKVASQPPIPESTEEHGSQITVEGKCDETNQLEEVWEMLYNDCLSALETCVQGDLKHFHKGRYMLAQSFYRRGKRGDFERAKDELSFCFKSSRSSFTINMWEIDGMVKKGRRRTPGLAGNKKALEVNLPESSRKFITCIRKYVLFYLKLLEEAKDIHTLDKALISFKADKRFSLCVEDLVPVALGRYIKALVSSMLQAQTLPADDTNNSEHLLEKLFTLFMEQGSLWSDVCSLPEMKGSGTSESSLYGYLHQYIYNLEKNGKLEAIEAINEKVRKRFKSPKLSNSKCAKVCRHVSVSWGRSLIIGLASITPLEPEQATEMQDLNLPDSGSEMSRSLYVNVQTDELWKSSFEDAAQLKELETKWDSVLSGFKNTIIRKTLSQNYDYAQSLLRCAYSFYRESSCVMLPSGVNLYYSPNRLVVAAEGQTKSAGAGVEFLDVSTPRKLILWAYTLVNGHCASISLVVKYCEENIKPKLKKGAGSLTTPLSTNTPSTASASTGKDGASHLPSSETEPLGPKSNELAVVGEKSAVASTAGEDTAPAPPGESIKGLSIDAKLQKCNNSTAERSHPTTAQSGGEEAAADPTEHTEQTNPVNM